MRTVEYTERDSLLHRLDPRVNLLISVTILTAAFLFTSTPYLIGTFASVLVLLVVGKIGREFLPWLKILVPFGIFAFFMWTLFSGFSLGATQSDVVAEIGFLDITQEGLAKGVSMPFRIMTMISIPIIFMMTVKNSELIRSLEQLGLPYKAAFGFGLSFRLVYVFQDEIRTIREAQKSRGAVLDRGSPVKRIKRNLPVIIPAMVRGFESSDDLSTALDLKGFDNVRNRNSIHRLQATTTDIVVAVLFLVVLTGILVARYLGYGVL